MIFGTIEDCAFIEDELFVLTREMRLMYKISVRDQICTGIYRVNDDDPYRLFPKGGLGGKLFEWNGNIVVTPSVNNKIQIYNVQSDEWKSIGIDCIDSEMMISRIFVGACESDYLCIFGCHYPLSIICNLKDQTIKTSNILYQKYLDNDWKSRPFFARYGNKRYPKTFEIYSGIGEESYLFDLVNFEGAWCGTKDRTNMVNVDKVECIYRDLEPEIVFKKMFMDGREVVQTNSDFIKIYIPNNPPVEISLRDEEKRKSRDIKSILNLSCKETLFLENKILGETRTIGLNEFLMLVE